VVDDRLVNAECFLDSRDLGHIRRRYQVTAGHGGAFRAKGVRNPKILPAENSVRLRSNEPETLRFHVR
jgi:hypothetical protein